MIDSLIIFLNHPFFPWVMALAILVYAAIFLAKYYYNFVRPSLNQLKQMSLLLEAQENSLEASDLPQINRTVSEMPLLQHQWRLFIQQLSNTEHQSWHIGLQAGQSAAKKNEKLFYHQSPREFFSVPKLLAPQLNLRFYQNLPQQLIQLGLLFTFIGLVAALYSAGNGLLAQDLPQLRASLQVLLVTATFKFATSLCAVFAAIVYAWVEKKLFFKLLQGIEKINQLLENNLFPEQLRPDREPAEKMLGKPAHTPPILGYNNAAESEKHMELINNNLHIAMNMGFNSLKKEIQRLNSGVAVATKRMVKIIHKVARLPEAQIESKEADNGIKDA